MIEHAMTTSRFRTTASNAPTRRVFFLAMAAVVLAPASGCMEDNNAEFARTAPPAPPDPYAGMEFKDRRAFLTKKAMEQKAEEKAKKSAKRKGRAK